MANMAFIDGAPLVAGLKVKVQITGESDKSGIITQVMFVCGYSVNGIESIKGKLDDGELFECNESDVSVEAIGRNRTRTLDSGQQMPG